MKPMKIKNNPFRTMSCIDRTYLERFDQDLIVLAMCAPDGRCQLSDSLVAKSLNNPAERTHTCSEEGTLNDDESDDPSCRELHPFTAAAPRHLSGSQALKLLKGLAAEGRLGDGWREAGGAFYTRWVMIKHESL